MFIMEAGVDAMSTPVFILSWLWRDWMYQHCELTDDFLSLHDCSAEKIEFQDGVLSFLFPEGFWITSQHPQNESDKTVSTDAAQVDFQITEGEIEGVCIYTFRENKEGLTIRKSWEPLDFIDAVNRGDYRIEFLTQYKSFQSMLFLCWVWFDQPPYHAECEIILDVEKVVYRWNQLRYDWVW